MWDTMCIILLFTISFTTRNSVSDMYKKKPASNETGLIWIIYLKFLFFYEQGVFHILNNVQ